jgi:lipopolysaccharide heptosyltransferase I
LNCFSMKILIVKLGSIGDIVHTLPALAAMREAMPDAQISWVVESRVAEVLRDNPTLDHLIEADTKAMRRLAATGETLLTPRQQFRRLRASSFDVALDFQGLIKSAAMAFLMKAKRRYGFAREALREPPSRFLLHKTFQVPLRSHVIVKNLTLAEKALNISVPKDANDFEFPIAVSTEHENEADRAIETVGEKFAILNPGGGWPTKLWSPERFAALADALWLNHNMASIVTFGPKEEDLANRVVSESKTGKAFAMNLSLKGFYALSKRARVYVGGDTGPTHLAVAARTPIVGLFGPTEWWRNGSPRAEDSCVERTDIDCRVDCHRRSCSKWICMDIEVERVVQAVSERLQRTAPIQISTKERVTVG